MSFHDGSFMKHILHHIFFEITKNKKKVLYNNTSGVLIGIYYISSHLIHSLFHRVMFIIYDGKSTSFKTGQM